MTSAASSASASVAANRAVAAGSSRPPLGFGSRSLAAACRVLAATRRDIKAAEAALAALNNEASTAANGGETEPETTRAARRTSRAAAARAVDDARRAAAEAGPTLRAACATELETSLVALADDDVGGGGGEKPHNDADAHRLLRRAARRTGRSLVDARLGPMAVARAARGALAARTGSDAEDNGARATAAGMLGSLSDAAAAHLSCVASVATVAKGGGGGRGGPLLLSPRWYLGRCLLPEAADRLRRRRGATGPADAEPTPTGALAAIAPGGGGFGETCAAAARLIDVCRGLSLQMATETRGGKGSENGSDADFPSTSSRWGDGDASDDNAANADAANANAEPALSSSTSSDCSDPLICGERDVISALGIEAWGGARTGAAMRRVEAAIRTFPLLDGTGAVTAVTREAADVFDWARDDRGAVPALLAPVAAGTALACLERLVGLTSDALGIEGVGDGDDNGNGRGSTMTSGTTWARGAAPVQWVQLAADLVAAAVLAPDFVAPPDIAAILPADITAAGSSAASKLGSLARLCLTRSIELVRAEAIEAARGLRGAAAALRLGGGTSPGDIEGRASTMVMTMATNATAAAAERAVAAVRALPEGRRLSPADARVAVGGAAAAAAVAWVEAARVVLSATRKTEASLALLRSGGGASGGRGAEPVEGGAAGGGLAAVEQMVAGDAAALRIRLGGLVSATAGARDGDDGGWGAADAALAEVSADAARGVEGEGGGA